MASNKFKTIPITKPEDYQLVYHSNQHGQIWLDAKNRPIPLTQTLTGHIDSTDPVLLWNSRVTREGYHSVPVAVSKGSAINSTAITQQPPAHSTPTSPIQNSLTIPQGIDPTEPTLKAVINDPQYSESSLKEAFDGASLKVGNVITPQKPQGAHNDASLDTSSETSETSMVNDDQGLPSNSKTYTQHDLDKLRTDLEEQFKFQKAIDKKNLEKEIQNNYLHQHQEQLATMASKITALQDNLVTADALKTQDSHTIQMLQQRLKLFEGANQTPAHVATTPFDPLANHSLLYNQSLVLNSMVDVMDKFDKSLNMQTATLKQTSATAKEHYISSAKTYDGKDCNEFSNWLDSVYRLSRISEKDLIEVALATSTGSLHKHISELMALGINWEVIKNKVQERFSEFGSPIVAQSKLSSFTQGTMAMHDYISEFTDLVEHAHQIKPSDSGSHLLATQFIQGISNLYIKSRLRFLISQNQLHNLSELFGFALQEDKKQKIRELDFGKNETNIDINAIKGKGCFKCGSEDHYIKDCPYNKDNGHNDNGHNNPSNTQSRGHRFHRAQGDESSIEQSLQTLTSLMKSLLKQMSQPQSSYHKPPYKSYGNKQQYNGHKPYHKSHHSKGKYKHNTRINELGDCTSDASSCSDQSDVEEEFDQQEPPTSDNSKN